MENHLNNDPEAVAIGAIMKALESLEKSRKSAVLNFVIQRMDNVVDMTQHRIPSITTDVLNNDIKIFLKSKDPRNKYQQVAVLAYFLIKKRGEEGINKDMIEIANKEALGRTIDDISSTLNDAKNKYGFFGAGSGGKKILLAYGEDVVDALPDQEKVKKLAKKGKIKKRRAKKVSKKPTKK